MREKRILPNVEFWTQSRVIEDEVFNAIAARERMESISLTSLKRAAYERALEEVLADLKEAREGKLELDDVWVNETINDITLAFDSPEHFLNRPPTRR